MTAGKAHILVQGLAILFALFVITSNIFYIADGVGGEAGMGRLGGAFRLQRLYDQGFVDVTAVAPGLPLDQAGVRQGDSLRFDRPFDFSREVAAGEHVGFTLRDPTRHRDVVAVPVPPAERTARARLIVIDGISALFAALIGLIVLVRARGTPSLIVLGLAIAGFDYTTSSLQTQAAGFAAWEAARLFCKFATPLLFLDFALLFYRENIGPLARWVWPAFAAALIVAAVAGVSSYVAVTMAVAFYAGSRLAPIAAPSIIFSAAILAFFIGWRKGTPALQRRYAIMLAALGCFILSALVLSASRLFTADNALGEQSFAAKAVFELLATAAPLLFAYAVLRHKVVDLGFAVNRALVYGVVSTVLLVAFGIVEWASEHFLPFKDLETNALVDGGIALAIFLAFHRLRDAAEHVIEGLFFRTWRDNEAHLRRFVGEAAFVGTGEALVTGFAAELTRFSSGAACALYRAAEDRQFALATGAGPARISADDPLVVSLRARGAPVEPSDTQSLLTAALALPMRQRGELTGFVLLGAKPAGDVWRPDEEELLGWAAHQIGLDLHALKIEQLEKDTAGLRQEQAILTAQLQIARELGAAR